MKNHNDPAAQETALPPAQLLLASLESVALLFEGKYDYSKAKRPGHKVDVPSFTVCSKDFIM